MSTIPTIFNEKVASYTAVGGKERSASSGISLVILNRPGFSRRSFFQEIEKTGFDNVISIESSSPHYDIEELSGRFPFVRFILPENELNLGQQINLAASEVESPLFYVYRSDMKVVAGGTAKIMAERLSVNEDEKSTGFKRLCTIPLILNSNYEILPTLVAPMTEKRKIRTAFFEPQTEDSRLKGIGISLYPFDGIGIYDRQRFIQLGGYDETLKNIHWQLMDFGFRAFLWGEEIAFNVQFKLSYDGEMPSEDQTVEESYKRFYLKNLAPVFRNDYAHLPFYKFPRFFSITGNDLFSSWEEFRQTRNWVKKNKYRFKSDAGSVTNRWDDLKTGE